MIFSPKSLYFLKFIFLFLLMGSSVSIAKTQPAEKKPAADFKIILTAVLSQAASIESQKAILDSAQEAKTAKSLYWTPTGSVILANQNTGTTSTSGNSTTLTANLNLFKFGGSELARNAAKSKVVAEEAKLNQVKEEVEATTANLIFQLIQARQIIEIRKGHVSVQQQLVDVAKERYRQGQLAEQEFEKAKVDLESSKISLNEAQLTEVQISNSLKTLAEMNPLINAWPLCAEFEKTQKTRKRSQDFFMSQAFAADVDYFHKTSQQLWRGSYLPSLDANGGWMGTNYGSSQQGQWYAGITLTIPLWDQWTGVAQAQESEASARSAAANLVQSLRQNESNLATLDLRLQLSRMNLESSQQSVAKLQQLRNDSLKRFRMGRSSVNDLLIDETRYLDAERSMLSSQFAYHQLVVELCHTQNESLLNCF